MYDILTASVFRHDEKANRTFTVLAFTPFGRLTLLRFVKLELGSRMWDPRTNLRQVAPRPPDREGIWQEWSQSLFQRAAHPMFVNGSEGAEKCVFPALQHLTLDFSVWQLGKEEGLFVSTTPYLDLVTPCLVYCSSASVALKHPPRSDPSSKNCDRPKG